MIKVYFLFALVLINIPSRSQDLSGPQIAAMGDAGVAIQHLWSNNSNAAGIAFIKKPSFAIAYENKYNIKELSSKSVVAAIPFKKFTFGGSFSAYSNGVLSHSRSGLSIAKKFGPKLCAALTFNYHQLRIDGYGNEQAFSADVGIQLEALRNLWIAAHVANPTRNHFSQQTDNLTPAQISFGAAYHFTDKLIASSEIEKTLGYGLDFKTGLAYQLIQLISLRGGFSANPFKQYGGFGLSHKSLDVDFSIASHPVLGISPQIAIGYEF